MISLQHQVPARNKLAKLLFICMLFTGMIAIVQPHSAFAQSSESASATPASQQHEPAAEEDETASYKTSASVRAIGKFFHLSPHAAAEAFEYFNFALLAGFVVFFLAKALPKAFRARQAKIDEQLTEARAATEQANRRLGIVEERLGRLDHEIDELRKRSDQEVAADEQRIKQSIEEERKKIVASAEQEIATASAVAERNLRKFAAELAMDRAMGRLKLTEQDDRALISDFTAGLENTDLAGMNVAGMSITERRN